MLRVGVRRGGGLAWIEQDAGGAVPSCGSVLTSCSGLLGLGSLVEGVALGEQWVAVFAAVALVWGDEFQGAVAVGFVVPERRRLRPRIACGRSEGEGLPRERLESP